MHQNFEMFFRRVLEDEGTGYEDVAGDNGGPTKCGITIFDVARWNNVKLPAGCKIAQLRTMSVFPDLVAKVHAIEPVTAGVIYKAYYWDEVKADDLPSGLDYGAVDYAVNSGSAKAASTLGALVGVKGHIVTDDMVRAVQSYGSLADLINHFQDDRKAYLEEIATYPHNRKFRNGWLAREARVRRVALDLAKGAPPMPAIGKAPKAVEAMTLMIPAADPPVASPIVKTATSRTVWSLLIAVGAYVCEGFKHAVKFVSDLAGHIPEISTDVSDLYHPASNLLDILQVKSVKIGLAIGLACLAVAIIRHIDSHLKGAAA